MWFVRKSKYDAVMREYRDAVRLYRELSEYLVSSRAGLREDYGLALAARDRRIAELERIAGPDAGARPPAAPREDADDGCGEVGTWNVWPVIQPPPARPREDTATAPYGRCPVCGERGYAREKRPGGNDTCERGHSYPSRDAT